MDFSQLGVSIEMQRSGAIVMIRPHIKNPTPLSLQYRMVVRQSSSNGSADISQNGEVQSGVASSAVSLSMPKDATCQVHLEIFQNDTLLREIDSSCSGASK